jgi:hypothetical protein
MLAEFIELSPTDNSKQGMLYLNPLHVVKVTKVPGLDPEKGILASNITDVNGKTTRVEGSPSQVRTILQSPR